MKKQYNKATAEFITLSVVDVITASNGISLAGIFDAEKERSGDYLSIFGE